MKREIPKNSTPIINEIIEKLACCRLTTYEFNIVMAVIRQTYGWNRKEAWIAGSILEKLTKISKENCYRNVSKLTQKKILIKNGKCIGLNKNVDDWNIEKPGCIVSVQTVSQLTSLSKKKMSELTSKDVSADIKKMSQLTSIKEKKDNNKINNLKVTASQVVLVPKKKEIEEKKYGNPEINKMLIFLKQKIEISDFKESQKYQRMFAKHILNLAKKWKNPQEEFLSRIEFIFSDPFRKKNCNSIKYFYGELKSTPTQQSNQSTHANYDEL